MSNDKFTTPSQRRKRLSNITNISLSANWSSYPREENFLKSCSKGGDPQLQQDTICATCRDSLNSVSKRKVPDIYLENMSLKRLLAEKEKALEAQLMNEEHMRKEFATQLKRLTQINQEMACYNSRLSKEGGQARDQLKLLQHEYCQMTAAYKTQMCELQVKLTHSQEQLKKVLEEQARQISTSLHEERPQTLRSSRSQIRRRHSAAGDVQLDSDWNSTKYVQDSITGEEAILRPGARRRSGRVVLLKESVPTLTLSETPPQTPSTTRSSSSIYTSLVGLEPLQETCEEEDNDSTACNSATSVREDRVPPTAVSSVATSRSEDATASLPSSSSSSSYSSSYLDSCRSDNPTVGSSSTKSSDSSSSSARGLRPLKTNTITLTAPEPKVSNIHSLKATNAGGGRRPLRKAVESVASYREPPLTPR